MATEGESRRLLRTRDTMDKRFAEPFDVASLARIACMSPSHFTRRFRAVFGETPHQYLYRRRIERAQWLLRSTDMPVSEVCLEVGYVSLGTFTRTFRQLVGETPTAHRERGSVDAVPGCFYRAWKKPSRFGEVAT